MKEVVVCQSCGLVYPSDYITGWGRKYGIGLGSVPVCEGLRTDYSQPIVYPTQPPQPEKAMHPVGVCAGSVIRSNVPDETEMAILAVEDPYMTKRADKIREHQKTKSSSLKLHFDTIDQ